MYLAIPKVGGVENLEMLKPLLGPLHRNGFAGGFCMLLQWKHCLQLTQVLVAIREHLELNLKVELVMSVHSPVDS